MKKTLLHLILVLLLCYSSLGAIIGVSPSILRYNKMTRGGYAEALITVSSSSEQIYRAHFQAEGDIADWLSYAPKDETFTISKNKPYIFNLIIQPPTDAKAGNYTAQLRITTDEIETVASGAGSSVIAQITLLIYVEVVGEEIIACRVGAISITNAEIGEPFIIRANIFNDGNVRLRPEIVVDVYNQLQTRILQTSNHFAPEILPTKNQAISFQVNNALSTGQYFADIFFKDCAVSEKKTFDILERGAIADSGQLLTIRTNDYAYINEPLPIFPLFKNTGYRKINAQFKGEIRNLENDKLVSVLESDALEVQPDETLEFKMFFTPSQAGEYQITGRVVYNNKITFDEKSKIVKIISTTESSSWLFYIIGYLIIGLLILILISKIRKAKT